MKVQPEVTPKEHVTRIRDLVDNVLKFNRVSRLIDNTFMEDAGDPEALITLPQADGTNVIIHIRHTKEKV